MATDLNSVIEKIKKLFALANRKTNNDGSSNEAEANAAMAMAQQLLAKYNLGLHTVTDSATKKANSAEPVSGPRERVRINRSAMYRWQQEFWKALAEANMCYHWVTTVREEHPRRKGIFRTVKRHVILGSAVNVAVVNMMGEYLTEVMERDLPYPNSERLSKSALSWREGMAERLVERVKAKMEAMKNEGFKSQDGATCTGLAVRNMAAVEEQANYDARYGAGSWARMKQREADYEAGRAAREARWAKEAQESIEKANAIWEAMTPAQKEAHLNRERKERERNQRRWQREQEKEAERLDLSAYGAGRRDAAKVNLDDQLK